jgi:hypothetical protein
MATWTAYTYLGLCLTEPGVRLMKGPTIVPVQNYSNCSDIKLLQILANADKE